MDKELNIYLIFISMKLPKLSQAKAIGGQAYVASISLVMVVIGIILTMVVILILKVEVVVVRLKTMTNTKPRSRLGL